ncbi:family 16 glycosylhydrolase, partial [Methylobacterium sp. E-016]|uniref:family 16 glycosylhydrolase n=1 Tax=Methylobacterium sp. E-016 TaxID=2836556 RepID=UPI001FB8DF47
MTINPNNLTATANLTFSEDFNLFRTWNGTTGLDITANVLAPLGNGNPGTSGYANNGELQWYVNPNYQPSNGGAALPSPFSTLDGVLTIEARHADEAIRPTILGQTYTSGVVSTYHEFSQTYGYFEMRAELPAGTGLWPAFWLMPADGSWPPEIDVMEQLGKDPSTIYTSVHSKVGGLEQVGSGHFQTTTGVSIADTSQGFHTYGVDWELNTITWYFDGREIFQATTPADANRPMYMIANLAVGGSWPGNPDGSTTFPAEMKIDYLRAYSALPTVPAAPHELDTLTFGVAQDAYGEDAQFVVKVDGAQVGGVQTAHASHADGAWDVVNLTCDFSVVSDVTFQLINDASDGHGHARNLYIASVGPAAHF